MRNSFLALAVVAGVSSLGLSSASAFPAAPIGDVASPIEQVRVVCNEWGHCWNTRPRHYRYGYGPRYYEPGYGYYDAPYYHRPGVSVGVPGFGFHFGL